MALLYGDRPRELPGAWRYAGRPLVSETLASNGVATTPSFFEVCRRGDEVAKLSLRLESTNAAGTFTVKVQTRLDHEDDTAWRDHRELTNADRPDFGMEYIDPRMQIRVVRVTATHPVKVSIRQA